MILYDVHFAKMQIFSLRILQDVDDGLRLLSVLLE